MYAPLTDKSGVQFVHEYLGRVVRRGPDGLEVTTGEVTFGDAAALPIRLHALLKDLRLLRRIPLSYLVPDARLLPPESIRFFNVDLTWLDRVIDGVLAAANTGTMDLAYDCGLLMLVRNTLDKELQEMAGTSWDPGHDPMTGLLIRSELTRRWPDMIVDAFAKLDATQPVPLLRSEPISRDLYIALFAGRPRVVRVGEPEVGLRFGVEGDAFPYTVNLRVGHGVSAIKINARGQESDRVLKIKEFADHLGGTSRMVAVHLQQPPYVQEFIDSDEVKEERGSVAPLPSKLPLRRGRSIDMTRFHARLNEMAELEDR